MNDLWKEKIEHQLHRTGYNNLYGFTSLKRKGYSPNVLHKKSKINEKGEIANVSNYEHNKMIRNVNMLYLETVVRDHKPHNAAGIPSIIVTKYE